MNEVEKMYENAGIVKRVSCFLECFRETCSVDCEHFKKLDLAYPPFTAEKQLAIVKQILFSTWWMNLKRLQFSEKFDEGLAQMINELWQDLTAEEHKQIKEILKNG